ncbi:MAG: YjbE family putative metal transport protein [Alphaproteobacteria bacterium]|nr:YjbE family putative metal transport protein [Alphaproteobacteria bacterium]
MFDFFSPQEIQAFLSIVAIDIVMSGDNAIIIGLAAAGLPVELRRRAIAIGIIAATLLRITFAAVTVQLLQIVGLTLAGGLLLLWVCWKMWRELRAGSHTLSDTETSGAAQPRPIKTFRQALTMIVVADVSMSLDNVLAVAGAARDHVWILVFGLALSIALMAVAANYIARLLIRHHWIAYVGLLIVAYVAGQMIWDGTHEVAVATGM